mmetsp:Transcript_18002/g.28469  ORF Transcript_18002/g.28469 Transcript_18002/m.28469 type:complete len:237 (-) Transcript_18002:193-903(-)
MGGGHHTQQVRNQSIQIVGTLHFDSIVASRVGARLVFLIVIATIFVPTLLLLLQIDFQQPKQLCPECHHLRVLSDLTNACIIHRHIVADKLVHDVIKRRHIRMDRKHFVIVHRRRHRSIISLQERLKAVIASHVDTKLGQRGVGEGKCPMDHATARQQCLGRHIINVMRSIRKRLEKAAQRMIGRQILAHRHCQRRRLGTVRFNQVLFERNAHKESRQPDLFGHLPRKRVRRLFDV